MKVNIREVGDHIEVFDVNGQFLFSADTEEEAYDELLVFGM